jgi:hypothetical protein
MTRAPIGWLTVATGFRDPQASNDSLVPVQVLNFP